MSWNCFRIGLTLIVTLGIAACSEQRSPTVTTDARLHSDAGTYSVPSQDRGTRYDAPWWYLSDAELAEYVRLADGRVTIGFKEEGTRGGVDDEGRVLVSAATTAATKRYLRSLGLNFRIEFELIPAVATTISPNIVPLLRSHPTVDYIDPVFPGVREVQDTTWNVHRVNAPSAWSQSTGSATKLLIIDSGVDDGHRDLDPAVIQACDGSDGLDNDGHGTAVGGVPSAVNNTVDIIGVSYGAALWSSKDGDALPDPDYTACGVEFGRVNDVTAINISSTFGSPNTALTDQIKGAWADGIVIAAAVGNDGINDVGYPADLPEVIAVTATDISDNRPTWANYGPEVELAAPGVDVETTCLSGATCTVSGTSFSTPHVVAAVGILKAAHSAWSNQDVRDALAETAVDLGPAGRDDDYGYGLIDIDAALDYTPSDPPPEPLSVEISGPDLVPPNTDCLWEALVSGGTSPYSYEWYRDGTLVSTSDYYLDSTGDSDFSLDLYVDDANGDRESKSMLVDVDSGAPDCGV